MRCRRSRACTFGTSTSRGSAMVPWFAVGSSRSVCTRGATALCWCATSTTTPCGRASLRRPSSIPMEVLDTTSRRELRCGSAGTGSTSGWPTRRKTRRTRSAATSPPSRRSPARVCAISFDAGFDWRDAPSTTPSTSCSSPRRRPSRTGWCRRRSSRTGRNPVCPWRTQRAPSKWSRTPSSEQGPGGPPGRGSPSMPGRCAAWRSCASTAA